MTYCKETHDLLEKLFLDATEAMLLVEVLDGAKLGKFLEINHRGCELLGVSREDVLGADFESILELHSSDVVRQSFPTFFEDRLTQIEARFVHNHSSLPIQFHARLLRSNMPPAVALIGYDPDEHVKTRLALKETTQALQTLLNTAPLAIYSIDMLGNITDWNQGAEVLFGWSKQEVIGRHVPIVQEERMREYESLLHTALHGDGIKGAVVTRHRRDGSEIDLSIWSSPLLDAHGAMTGAMIISIDVTDRTKAELNFNESQERFRHLVEFSPDGIFLSQEGIILYANPAGVALTRSKSVDEIIGKTVFSFIHSESQSLARERYASAIRQNPSQVVPAELKLIRSDGTCFYGETLSVGIPDRGKAATLTIVSDISDRKEIEQQLRQIAYYDSMTGLPNRRWFEERLTDAIASATAYSHKVAVLFVDIDRFKRINDFLGHFAGDIAIGIIVQRLKSCLRDEDIVARMSGDEFMILLPHIGDDLSAIHVGYAIKAAFVAPIVLENREFHVTPSIGIATFPDAGATADELLRNADVAVHEAKDLGGNRFVVYSSVLGSQSHEQILLENDLRKALERGEFLLHFQPRVDVATGRVIGAEALLRWTRPEVGPVPPLSFIPLAEETGLIVPIGEWVLRTACMQNKLWQDEGFPPIRMAVNVSAKQFEQGNILALLEKVLTETRLAAEWLELEITESTMMENAEEIVNIIQAIRKMGIHVSMDDFGTGYSSLSYLRQFQLNTLKIDRSFVRDLHENPDDAAIVSAVIHLAHHLHVHVVAEGVETETQLDYLRKNGCDEVQGYIISPPVPSDKFVTFFKTTS